MCAGQGRPESQDPHNLSMANTNFRFRAPQTKLICSCIAVLLHFSHRGMERKVACGPFAGGDHRPFGYTVITFQIRSHRSARAQIQCLLPFHAEPCQKKGFVFSHRLLQPSLLSHAIRYSQLPEAQFKYFRDKTGFYSQSA